MAQTLNGVKFPELVIGIAGPIGVDVDAITDSTTVALRGVGYRAIQIKLTEEMAKIEAQIERLGDHDFYSETKYKMDYANKICSNYQERSTIASIGIRAIYNRRRI